MASWSAEIQVQINFLQPFHNETFTFLKYCENYIVGYSTRGVQIIKGKCHYGGIRDLGAFGGGHYPVDLPTWIGGVVTANLTAEIIGKRLTSTIDLPTTIGGHLPENLGAFIDMHPPENLSAYIRGFDYRELPAHIGVMYGKSLPTSIYSVPPRNLSAYLKVWPMEHLSAFIHGWDTKDLSAYLNIIAAGNMPAIIGAHPAQNIRARLIGWVREAEYDLGGLLGAFDLNNLNAVIRGTFMEQLPAYLFPIVPRNISAFIHGWDTKDLSAEIDAKDYPWQLSASINVTGGFSFLRAAITGKAFVAQPTDLSAYILVTQGRTDLFAFMSIQQARNLTAYIDPGKDRKDLTAEIYPKRIRLTGILSVITMEHVDLGASISVPCFFSDFRLLPASLNPVFLSDLGAQIRTMGYIYANSSLSASIGYALNNVVQDKLTINLSIAPQGIRTEDKINVAISVFRSGLSLGAYINPDRGENTKNLTAYINTLAVVPYDFDSWKGHERVYDATYTQELKDYEAINISFESVVRDYFYSSGSDVVARIDRSSHFKTKVASYYSPATSLRLDRKLHKIKYLFDMRKFETTDEAVRYAIWYVTTTPIQNLGAFINSIAPRGSSDMSARIGVTEYFSENNNLTSNIIGESPYTYDVIIGYTDDGVGYLEI
jgi:hypothetical protein